MTAYCFPTTVIEQIFPDLERGCGRSHFRGWVFQIKGWNTVIDFCVEKASWLFKRARRCHINMKAAQCRLIRCRFKNNWFPVISFQRLVSVCVCLQVRVTVVRLWSELNCTTLACIKVHQPTSQGRAPKTQLQPPIRPLSPILFVSRS